MIFIVIGAGSALIGVMAGALGAHSLSDRLSVEMLAIFETAVRYQMYHSFALFVVGWAVHQYPEEKFRSAGWFFVVGILVFSGSLYGFSLSGARWLGMITPFGGVAFLAGWAVLGWRAWKAR